MFLKFGLCHGGERLTNLLGFAFSSIVLLVIRLGIAVKYQSSVEY